MPLLATWSTWSAVCSLMRVPGDYRAGSYHHHRSNRKSGQHVVDMANMQRLQIGFSRFRSSAHERPSCARGEARERESPPDTGRYREIKGDTLRYREINGDTGRTHQPSLERNLVRARKRLVRARKGLVRARESLARAWPWLARPRETPRATAPPPSRGRSRTRHASGHLV